MFEKLKKRRAYPVEGIEETFVRLFTQGEKPRFEALEGDDKGWFMFGKILVHADGSQVIPQNGGESDIDFAKRVGAEMSDVDDGVLLLIRDTWQRFLKGESVPVEDIAKN